MKREQTTSCCIFACFLVLALKSPLLAAFAVQFLLAVSLCQLGRMEGGNSPNLALPGTSSGPYVKIWAVETEEITAVSRNNLHVVHIVPLY